MKLWPVGFRDNLQVKLIMDSSLRNKLLIAIRDARAPIAAFSLGIATLSDPAIRMRIDLGEWCKVSFATTQAPVGLAGDNGEVVGRGHYSLLLKPSIYYIDSDSLNMLVFLNLVVSAAVLHVGDAFAAVS